MTCNWPFTKLTILLISICAASEAAAQNHVLTSTRIFWQDRETDQLSYADLVISDHWSMRRGWVTGFPKLDAEKHHLVQMKHCDGVLMVGVRDGDGGHSKSGWVAIDTGVSEQPHGNHTDWKYLRKPSVKHVKLDTEQGNPAHLYVYNRRFYLANDTKNGFTKAAPQQLMAQGLATFFPGGGNHITMAAAGPVVYSTWIDGEGPNVGRVDVVNTANSPSKIAYSFRLPTGIIHGATVNSGKVFFAPADGVCWVKADTSLSQNAESVAVNHLALGKDAESDKPLRTGAFENSRNWVLCATGQGAHSALCMINAESPQPTVIKLGINVADGLKLMTPETVLSLGRRYAFLFHDRTDPDSDIQEKLTIVELDPNRDRDFSDARELQTLSVGASKVKGHYGHHAISFGAYGRQAVFTEPGTGIINVMALPSMRVVARFRVGGAPDHIVAVGAKEHHH